MEEKQSQIGNNKETQRWGTARKYFPPWARGTVEEVVLPEPRDQEHLVEAEAMDETQPCQRRHPRQEWEETSLSLPAAHAGQSPFQASHWPNSATDLGTWEMQTIGISPHHPTQYRAGRWKEKKWIWEQKCPRLSQKQGLCIDINRSVRARRKVAGWGKGRS